MRSGITQALITAAFFLSAGACSDGLGPASELSVFVSAPSFVELGDTIELVGVAHNGSESTILAGVGCEPGIGFLVTDSTTAEIDLYAGLDWLCPQRDNNVLAPGETDVVEWAWLPPAPGLYSLRSVVKIPNGPQVLSELAELRIEHPR